jgi:hypothetical protein
VPDENASRMSFSVKKFLGILKQINGVYIERPSRAACWLYRTPGLLEKVAREKGVSS